MLAERISAYIQNNAPVTYGKLVLVASGAGFTELEVIQALQRVHRDKRIRRRVLAGEITYDKTPPPAPKPDFGAWGREHYPHVNLIGTPIPFYSSVTDGPTECYSEATRQFCRDRREAFKKENERIRHSTRNTPLFA